jgi:hypothetical protein
MPHEGENGIIFVGNGKADHQVGPHLSTNENEILDVKLLNDERQF